MIVKNLRESREILNLKQIDVAKRINAHFSTVSGWETGKDTIPLKRLIAYANTFEYSLDYLFGLMNKNNYQKIILDMEILSENLFNLRNKNKITQEAVGKKLNISTGTYCDYENGKELISTTSLYGLTKIYKPFSIDKLFQNNQNKK
jgi:transcriptional regulator with XRE-family HTH domain